MGRPSEIEVTVERGTDGAPAAVASTGSAVLVMQGHLEV